MYCEVDCWLERNEEAERGKKKRATWSLCRVFTPTNTHTHAHTPAIAHYGYVQFVLLAQVSTPLRSNSFSPCFQSEQKPNVSWSISSPAAELRSDVKLLIQPSLLVFSFIVITFCQKHCVHLSQPWVYLHLAQEKGFAADALCAMPGSM